MIVYGSGLSPFVRKVLVYAAEKGVALDLVAAGLGRGGPDFAEASPFGKMPGFRDPGADGGKDFCISDSTAIIAYLEAKYPDPALIPAEPMARARTVWFEEFADTILFAVASKIFFNRFVGPKVLKVGGDESIAAAAVAQELPPLLDYLESVVSPSGFLVADRLTVADIAVASPFVNLRHVDVPVDPARWPKAAAYLAGVHARPSFARLIADEQRMVARLA